MAKISELPNSATPLTGEETFPVVQLGSTKKARIADIKMTVDTELSETSENPVQNKVITETLYDHDLGINTLWERSDLKEFKLRSKQTLETEVSSVEFNFATSAIGAYPTELLVTLVVPPPTQTLAYVKAEFESAGGSKNYFISCGGDGSNTVIKPDTGLNFLGGFRLKLSTPSRAVLLGGR